MKCYKLVAVEAKQNPKKKKKKGQKGLDIAGRQVQKLENMREKKENRRPSPRRTHKEDKGQALQRKIKIEV